MAVEVTKCQAREPFRINGDFAVLKTQPGALQVRERHFSLLPVGQPLVCGAGEIQYTVQVTGGTITGEPVRAVWRVRPIYHLTASVGLGFDFGAERTFPVVNQKIAMADHTSGLTGALGFIWYPGGVDFENMESYQHVFNPFVLFNLDAPKDGFVIGTALTANGGISVGLGISVRKVAALKTNAVGETFTGQGEPSTEKVWAKDGVGWYVGVILDTTFFGKLRGLVAMAK